MLGTPLSPELIKAETAYRLERTRRAFWSARRRECPEQVAPARPQPRLSVVGGAKGWPARFSPR